MRHTICLPRALGYFHKVTLTSSLECWQQRRGLAPEQQSSWLYNIWELIKD